jgi:phasin family protein
MDADSKKAGTKTSSGEKVFVEQELSAGLVPQDLVESAASSLAIATQLTAASEPSALLSEEQPTETGEAKGAEATPPPATAKNTSPDLKITEPKEKIMASAPNNQDMKQATDAATESMTNAMNEVQNRAKAAYEKGNEAVGELTEFTKGNVEAVVESSKIIASGMQDIGRSYAEEAKAAYEQMTADLKELAAVKSPTELFQLQGKIMRRNFDTLVATSTKSSEAMMKLANEASAPLSGRVNVAAEKITKTS